MQFLDVGKEVDHDCAECAIQFHADISSGHEVDGDCIHCGSFHCIEYEYVLLPFLDKVILQGKEDVGGNCNIHASIGMTKFFHSSLFIVFMTLSRILLIDGLLPAVKYLRKFFCKQLALNTFGHPMAKHIRNAG